MVLSTLHVLASCSGERGRGSVDGGCRDQVVEGGAPNGSGYVKIPVRTKSYDPFYRSPFEPPKSYLVDAVFVLLVVMLHTLKATRYDLHTQNSVAEANARFTAYRRALSAISSYASELCAQSKKNRESWGIQHKRILCWRGELFQGEGSSPCLSSRDSLYVLDWPHASGLCLHTCL